ncbi:MAG: HAD family hydrolase [Frankia sp.]
MNVVAIRLACLDMAGTTVADRGVVESAFTVAIGELGIEPGSARYDRALAYVRATMGQSKREVFGALLGDGTPLEGQRRRDHGFRAPPEAMVQGSLGEDRADVATAAFERAYEQVVRAGGVPEIPGARAVFADLRAAGVKVALTTGFARPTQSMILEALGWHDAVDLAVCPADTARGRPWPDMIQHAARRLGVDDPRAVAVAGDTSSDMQAGVRAAASIVAGVLTGAHDGDQLAAAGATHVVASIVDVGRLILSDR